MSENNFDFLRLIFALFVIITHSFVLSGSNDADWMARITGNQMTFSHIGVAGFFTISGNLVTQSLQRSKNLPDYFVKRILRIYPALVVVLSVTVLLGFFVYAGSLNDYLHNKSVWTYIPQNLLLLKFQYSITGIFETNPFKKVINGSLSTIPYEVMLYILLSFLFFIKNNLKVISILGSLFIFLVFSKIFLSPFLERNHHPFILRRCIDFSGFFVAGSLLSFLKIETASYRKGFVISAFAIWCIALFFRFYTPVEYIVLPTTVIGFGVLSTTVINNIRNKIGDISYGLYLFAFPVQQTLMHFLKLNTISLLFFSTITTLPFAFLSWHLIEKRMLKFKYYFA